MFRRGRDVKNWTGSLGAYSDLTNNELFTEVVAEICESEGEQCKVTMFI